MFEYLILGAGFAFAAAVQPGPLQAFLLTSAARNGWRRTLPACFAPLLSDGPIALAVLLLIQHLPAGWDRVLQSAGGLFLIYLAWAGYREWRAQTPSPLEEPGAAPRTLIQAATVNLLNPNPYLAWSLVLGPAILRAWEHNPTDAIILILAFYVTMVGVLAATILLFGTTALLTPRARAMLVLISCLVLAVLGLGTLAAGLFQT